MWVTIFIHVQMDECYGFYPFFCFILPGLILLSLSLLYSSSDGILNASPIIQWIVWEKKRVSGQGKKNYREKEKILSSVVSKVCHISYILIAIYICNACIIHHITEISKSLYVGALHHTHKTHWGWMANRIEKATNDRENSK